jgi:hypothetical protein
MHHGKGIKKQYKARNMHVLHIHFWMLEHETKI